MLYCAYTHTSAPRCPPHRFQPTPTMSTETSRRDFLQKLAFSAGLGGVVLGGKTAEATSDGVYPAGAPGPLFDFTKASGAFQADKVVDSACQFCNSNCRLKVHLKDGRIIDVLGEPADPVQAGGLCVKAEMMTQLVYNRFRLTQPLKRVGGEKGSADSKFEPCSWDEALDIIAKKFLALRDAGEAKAIANKTSGRLQRGTGSIIGRFFTLLGSPNDTDVGPVCNDAGGDALGATFGMGNFTNGYGKDENTGKEDLGSAKYFLFLGTNQAETHPVTFCLPAPRAREDEGEARGHRSAPHADRRAGRRMDRAEAAHRPRARARVAPARHRAGALRPRLRREVGARVRRAEEAPRASTATRRSGRRKSPASRRRRSRPSPRDTRRRSRRRSSATRASRISSALSIPIARSPSSRRSPATSASTAAAAISCTTRGRAG